MDLYIHPHPTNPDEVSIMDLHQHSSEVVVNYKSLDFMGYGYYRIGDDGSVWSHRKRKDGVWKRLTPAVEQKMGYLRVTLTGTEGRSKRKIFFIHVLVMRAFVGPKPEGMECCHYPDPDPTNNRLDNLKYGTKKENQGHRKEHGTAYIGEKQWECKVTEQDVRDIRKAAESGESTKSIRSRYGLSNTQTRYIIKRKSWKHVT